MKQPWPPAMATDKIRAIARSDCLELSYTRHARERMQERGLLTGDILYVLKNGFVYQGPQSGKVEGYFKYRMEAQTPNSGSRTVGVVVIPDKDGNCALKVVTVMWINEC